LHPKLWGWRGQLLNTPAFANEVKAPFLQTQISRAIWLRDKSQAKLWSLLQGFKQLRDLLLLWVTGLSICCCAAHRMPRPFAPARQSPTFFAFSIVIPSLEYDSASTAGSDLAAFWQDPEFNSEQQAFYYVRVLEIPTPRWSTYDAKTLCIEPMAPAFIQERAITSSIWYKPEGVL